MSKKLFSRLIRSAKTDCKKVADVLKMRPHRANDFDEAGNSHLHAAVEKREYDLTKLLLDSGADPNARNNMGYTPLHFAVILKDFKIVELLVKNNGNVNARSNSGKTPLHLFTLQGESEASVEIAELLLKNYASMSVRDAAGFTPLDYLNSTR